MTQTDPDPFPRPVAETWAIARREYLAGASAAVVAERHGLSLRSLRRRAAVEGWRRSDPPDARTPDAGPSDARLSSAEIALMGLPRSERAAIEKTPELEHVRTAEDAEALALMFNADAGSFRRFAFRRSTEAAIMGGPTEALAWARLVHVLTRIGPVVDADTKPFKDVDYRRAHFLRMIRIMEAGKDDKDLAD